LRSFGIPWQTTWLTDEQTVLGKTPVIEVGRDGSLDVDDVLIAQRSSSSVVTPGTTWGPIMSKHLGGQAARLAHLELFFRGLDGDVHYLV